MKYCGYVGSWPVTQSGTRSVAVVSDAYRDTGQARHMAMIRSLEAGQAETAKHGRRCSTILRTSTHPHTSLYSTHIPIHPRTNRNTLYTSKSSLNPNQGVDITPIHIHRPNSVGYPPSICPIMHNDVELGSTASLLTGLGRTRDGFEPVMLRLQYSTVIKSIRMPQRIAIN